MEVVGWGSPVGLAIFMVAFSVSVVLLSLAVRVAAGKGLK
jgi:hypothetical protein